MRALAGTRLAVAVGGAVLLTLGAVAASTSSSATATAGASPRPNVVVVMTDDQTQESVRVMTNVRRLLIERGTTFLDSYVSFPLCCPSRATFLTGQYGHNNTVMGNQPPQGGYQKLRPTHANTLPAWLQAAGYRTVHIGKYLNGYGRDNPTEIPPGWSEWYGSVDPSTYRFYGYTLNENGRLVTYGSRPQDYQADVYAGKAVDAVRRLAPSAQPFFLNVAFLAPHSGGPREADDPRNQATPVPAPRHRDRFATEPLFTRPSFNEADVSDKPASVRARRLLGPPRMAAVTENYRQRLESLLAVDEAVGRIVDALSTVGELDRTLIVFTSDNGFFHGEHRIQAGKVQVYEPSVRVPLVLRGPGIPAGRAHQQPVVNVDWAATIADAANARPGRRLDGRSLLSLAQNPMRRWGRDILHETPSYSALRTPRWVWVEHTGGERELYDLATDHDQLQSRHSDPALVALRQSLAARLARLRGCAGATCYAGPGARLSATFRRGARGCTRSAVRLRVISPGATRVEFRLAGRLVRTDARAPFTATVARTRLRAGRATLVRVLAAFADGRAQTLDRALRRCS